jgi:hypothetical protein
MDDVSEQRGAGRPTVVTVAVAIWWTVLAVRTVEVVVGIVRLDREDPALVPAGLVGAVLGIGFCALLAWGALRTARGSGTARFWLALVSAFAVLNVVIAVFAAEPSWTVLEPLALGVAAVLTYLPSARPWFPRAERRPRRVEPRTIGWDPQTGERITEQHGSDGRG